MQPGTGLSVTGGGVLNHTNTVASGTYTKVTVDGQGHVSTGTTLSAGDIPSLDTSKITTGTFGTSLLANDSVTGAKLADSSTVQFGGAGSTAGVVTFPTAEFKGQYFFDELNGDLYIWTGSAWLPVTITSGELVYGGTYDASINRVGSVTSAGTAVGLTAGAILPAASSTNNRYYLVVSDSGNGSGNAPNEPLAPPDMILSNGATWDLIDVSNAIAGQTATNISFTPYGAIIATNVQTALQELDDEKLAKAGGTVTGALEIGTTGSLVFEGSTADAYETTLTVVDPTADRTISLPNSTGTLITTGDTGVITSSMITDGTIVNGDISASAGIEYSKLAALSAGRLIVGNASNVPTAVDITGDVTINSSGVTAIGSGVIVNADINASAAIDDTKLAAISSSNKVSLSAIDIDGGTDIGTALADVDLIIVDDGGGGTNRKAAVTRISDYTFGKVTGDISIANDGTASIASGVIVNADINASAAIADTKLATISTAGKVSNSATTATSTNTASAIVARDASGNFSAGTITATFSGNGASITSLSAANLSGTIPSGVLGNSSLFVGTTSIALNRASANLGLTGISSIALPGATSGTITVTPAATAGTTAITIPATTGTLVTTGDTASVTNAMLAGSIAYSKLSLSNSIVNADIASAAAIAYSKLSLSNSIVNADIAAAAAIVDTKLATISTAGKVSGSAITSGTIGGSTAISTSGAISTTTTLAVGQSSAAANTDLDIAGTYAQTVVAVAALAIDCSTGNYFTKTIAANSTFTVSNIPTSRAYSFTLELTHTSGTVTWFSGVEWPGGTAPTLTTGKTHLFMFVTDDGGTRWRGSSLINYNN
jgi:hypothetical protein